MGPEPEGTTDVEQEGLSSRPGPAGGVPPPAGVEGDTGQQTAFLEILIKLVVSMLVIIWNGIK